LFSLGVNMESSGAVFFHYLFVGNSFCFACLIPPLIRAFGFSFLYQSCLFFPAPHLVEIFADAVGISFLSQCYPSTMLCSSHINQFPVSERNE